MDWVVLVLSGASMAAVIKLVESVIIHFLNRKEKRSDDQVIDLKKMQEYIHSLRKADRVILHDRIKYLGRAYIRAGKVSFEGRKDLADMHGIYHNELGGNGNLDQLMANVMELPLKE